MYIKNIKLTNYRNFECLNGEDGFSLGKNATILIGKNGVGKTNILDAMKQALSFIFRREKGTPQYEFLNSLDKRIRIKSFLPTDPRYYITPNGLDFHYPVDIETPMSMSPVDVKEDNVPDIIHWHMHKENASKGIDESYASASSAFWSHYPNFKGLPVIAFYSAAFPHVTAQMGKNIQKILDFGNELPQNHGYYKWDDIMDCNPIWREYLSIKWWNNLIAPTEDNQNYVDAICKCLVNFSRPLPVDENLENKDIELEELTMKKLTKTDFKIVFDFKNGRQMTFDSLPDGYNRIFSIVFDIANRSYILNHHCNPEGIVFIDEIETHLHPSLAQEVMDRLLRAFPKLQFIISTHSPLVLSNFRQDVDHVVYQLTCDEHGQTKISKPLNSYGVDYNSMLADEMETPIRNSLLQELRDAYYYWKREKDEVKMEKVLQKIINRVGEDSSIVKSLREDKIGYGVH